MDRQRRGRGGGKHKGGWRQGGRRRQRQKGGDVGRDGHKGRHGGVTGWGRLGRVGYESVIFQDTDPANDVRHARIPFTDVSRWDVLSVTLQTLVLPLSCRASGAKGAGGSVSLLLFRQGDPRRPRKPCFPLSYLFCPFSFYKASAFKVQTETYALGWGLLLRRCFFFFEGGCIRLLRGFRT